MSSPYRLRSLVCSARRRDGIADGVVFPLSVPYAALAEVFERIDSTTKRLEIAEYLTNFLCSVIERTPKDLLKVVYLCINRVSEISSIPIRTEQSIYDSLTRSVIPVDLPGLRGPRARYR